MRGHATPRSLGAALDRVRARAQPATLLGAVQGAWAGAVGAAVAAEADPVAERDGVVTVACRSATWAQELDLLQADLLAALNRSLSEADPAWAGQALTGLRFTADGWRRV